MTNLSMIFGIVAIAIGLPLLCVTLYSIYLRKPEESIKDAKDHPLEAITTSFRIGIFMKGVADLQGARGEGRTTLILLIISLALCMGGYLLLEM